MFEFGIELALRNIQLIYKIKKLLGVVVVSFRNKENRNKTVIFRIRNKSHLINIILPIFDKYPLISNKQYDYLRFREAILKRIIYYKDLDFNYICPTNPLNSVESILNKPYLSSWLVGFIEAESCFSIYQPINRNSKEASFEISQTDGEILILAICKYLSFSNKVYKNKTNSFKIKVSSLRSIVNVINFLNKALIKLMGYKKLQYSLWLKELRNIKKFSKKIKIPNNY